MVELAVVNFCGNPVNTIAPISIDRSREVNVGRSAECELVLPDADRHISRIQARIICDAQGNLAVLNCSTVNSIFVDSVEVQPSERIVILPSNNIMIGLYELTFRTVADAPSPPIVAQAPRYSEADGRLLPGGESDDSWSHLLEGISTDSHAALDRPTVNEDRAFVGPTGRTSPPSVNALWAQPLSMPQANVTGATQDPLQLGSRVSEEADLDSMLQSSISLDAVFEPDRSSSTLSTADLSPTTPIGGLFHEEASLVNSLLQDDGRAVDNSFDPQALFGANPVAQLGKSFEVGAPIEASDLEAVFDLPKVFPAGDLLAEVMPYKEEAAPVRPRTEPTAIPPLLASSDGHDPLLAALFEGAGWTKPLPNIALDAAYLRRLGQLFKNTVEGSLDLALIQKEVKREIGGGAVPPAGSQANIFFAVSDIQSVLQHMLCQPYPGFVDAHQTTQSVFSDFKLHEMAMLVAVRATLVELMEMLAPAAIAKTGSARTLVDAMAPAKEKARLWDRYTSTFSSAFGDDREAMWSFVAKIFCRHYVGEAASLSTSQETAK